MFRTKRNRIDFGGPYCTCCDVTVGHGSAHHRCDCATCTATETFKTCSCDTCWRAFLAPTVLCWLVSAIADAARAAR
jgi:hypothetical protein